MLQWFIRFPEFCAFTEFPFRLRKTTPSRFRLRNSVLRPIHTTRKLLWKLKRSSDKDFKKNKRQTWKKIFAFVFTFVRSENSFSLRILIFYILYFFRERWACNRWMDRRLCLGHTVISSIFSNVDNSHWCVSRNYL